MNDKPNNYGPTFNVCIGLGVFFGVLSWIAWKLATPPVRFDQWFQALALSWLSLFLSFPIAFLCSIVAVPALSEKNLRTASFWLLVVVASITVAAAIFTGWSTPRGWPFQ